MNFYISSQNFIVRLYICEKYTLNFFAGDETVGHLYNIKKHSMAENMGGLKYSYTDSRRLHQMDAASVTATSGFGALNHHELSQARATSCSSDKTVMISGVVMLAIMLINCAVCLAMFCKTH